MLSRIKKRKEKRGGLELYLTIPLFGVFAWGGFTLFSAIHQDANKQSLAWQYLVGMSQEKRSKNLEERVLQDLSSSSAKFQKQRPTVSTKNQKGTLRELSYSALALSYLSSSLTDVRIPKSLAASMTLKGPDEKELQIQGTSSYQDAFRFLLTSNATEKEKEKRFAKELFETTNSTRVLLPGSPLDRDKTYYHLLQLEATAGAPWACIPPSIWGYDDIIAAALIASIPGFGDALAMAKDRVKKTITKACPFKEKKS